MKNLAIITARGGSKRIPKKNIKDFLGKPIIAYSIEAAITSKCFDEVMVSTDDSEIVEIANKFGAKIPFLRSKKNSDDYATTSDVLLEVLDTYKSNGFVFENACCIYPTAPFVSSKVIEDSYKIFSGKDSVSLIPVVRFSYPIQRAFKKEGDYIKMIQPEHINSRSQDLEPLFHDAGQFYWFRIKEFLENKNLITDKTSYIEISELNSHDIDNKEDWKIAELKYKYLFGNK
jgi:N-acylneuraminate cytidylyltransferase